jgi:hypothetical protein
MAGDLAPGLVRVGAVDRLLHDRSAPFAELELMANAELRVALQRLRPRLDSARRVVLFADHGFRPARTSREWVHGGPSMMERLVPVLWLSAG